MEPMEITDDIFRGGARRIAFSEDEGVSVILAVESASYDEYVLRCEIAGVKSLGTREEFEV